MPLPYTLRTVSILSAAALTAALTTTAAADTPRQPPNNPGLPVFGDLPEDDPGFTAGLRVHDPVLVRGGPGEDSYVFGTGNPEENDGTIQIRSSRDERHWEYAGTVWDEKPQWLTEEIPGVETLWAPEVYEYDGTYHLYYAASTFGSQRSLIALATNTTLDPQDPEYEWVDRGKVIETFPGDPYNAIDPGIVRDAEGGHWLTFGSFWSGIALVELDRPGGVPAEGAEIHHIADRGEPPNAIEAPDIVHRDGFYYLFVSLDHCCSTDSDYKIAVGRADDVTGPYLDRDGVPMLEGGATVIVGEEGTIHGSGGQSVAGDILAYHYYDSDLGPEFDFRLALRTLHWTPDGWPYVR